MNTTRFAQITQTVGAGLTIEHAITRNGGWLRADGKDFTYPLTPEGHGWQIGIRNPQHRNYRTLWRRISVGRIA